MCVWCTYPCVHVHIYECGHVRATWLQCVHVCTTLLGVHFSWGVPVGTPSRSVLVHSRICGAAVLIMGQEEGEDFWKAALQTKHIP